ncbi:MAG: hypothetical protein HY052_08580 [Proteobacteria bacterium]|nr:hypothetical protein [Pseudomonadota bacterium]
MSGQGQFSGTAATPQKFEDGAVIVKQGDSVRLVQPSIFEETYRHADGAALKASQMSASGADKASQKRQISFKPK